MYIIYIYINISIYIYINIYIYIYNIYIYIYLYLYIYNTIYSLFLLKSVGELLNDLLLKAIQLWSYYVESFRWG